VTTIQAQDTGLALKLGTAPAMWEFRWERWWSECRWRRSSPPDPLAIDPAWPLAVPLLGWSRPWAERAAAGVSREDVSRNQLGRSLRHPRPPAVLWMLCPSFAAAERRPRFPPWLRSLAELLEGQFCSAPPLLHALVERKTAPFLRTGLGGEAVGTGALAAERFRWGGAIPCRLPGSLSEVDGHCLNRHQRGTDFESHFSVATVSGDRRSQPQPPWGLRLRNTGLHFCRAEPLRRRKRPVWPGLSTDWQPTCSPTRAWSLEGWPHGRSLIAALQAQGGTVRARLRSSVASFRVVPACRWPLRLGPRCPWRCLAAYQAFSIPAARHGQSGRSSGILLPTAAWKAGAGLASMHGAGPLPCCCITTRETGGAVRLGSLNVCIAPAERPHQRPRCGIWIAPFRGRELLELIELWRGGRPCSINGIATQQSLSLGGYGSLGFCIDSNGAAARQGIARVAAPFFRSLLSGLWRERLAWRQTPRAGNGRHRRPLERRTHGALARHDRALGSLPLEPLDHGRRPSAEPAPRIVSSAPLFQSPFCSAAGG